MTTRDKDAEDTKNNNQRTRIEDLPREEKELNKDEQKKIKGGPHIEHSDGKRIPVDS
jgi:hypothetical protein